MGLCSSSTADENIFKQDEYGDYAVVFSRQQLAEIFDKYDADDNDMLQLTEVECMVKDMLEAVLQIQCRKLSGKPSLRPLLANFKKRLEDALDKYKLHAVRLVNAIDSNKNGKISKKEFFTYIEGLQRTRKEGIIGVLAAGDDGSLIKTHSQYLQKKEKEGDLYETSARATSDAKKRGRSKNQDTGDSALARIASKSASEADEKRSTRAARPAGGDQGNKIEVEDVKETQQDENLEATENKPSTSVVHSPGSSTTAAKAVD
mmetsp:Transcript_4088/g.8164  ORF Transcript_4088/g.8164 Transcript_4088/m.8164 type:complete len:261 (-) Transcript_4088:79-861(-)